MRGGVGRWMAAAVREIGGRFLWHCNGSVRDPSKLSATAGLVVGLMIRNHHGAREQAPPPGKAGCWRGTETIPSIYDSEPKETLSISEAI